MKITNDRELAEMKSAIAEYEASKNLPQLSEAAIHRLRWLAVGCPHSVVAELEEAGFESREEPQITPAGIEYLAKHDAQNKEDEYKWGIYRFGGEKPFCKFRIKEDADLLCEDARKRWKTLRYEVREVTE